MTNVNFPIAAVFTLMAATAYGATWTEHSGKVVDFGDAVPYTLWNDPTVIKDGSQYRMWMSGGDVRNLNHIVVQVFGATSSDGLKWQIDPKPMITPGPAGSWDSLRIETPTVIKAGNTYHMYYAGADEANAAAGTSSIGHAVSPDGVHWTKDTRNPVITGQTSDKNKWGYGGVGEPAALYDPLTSTFAVYFVSMRYPLNRDVGQAGVLLSRSTDGSRFSPVTSPDKQPWCVATRDVPGAPTGALFGYSSPAVIKTQNGIVHLFPAFLVAPAGPTSVRQVTIDHLISSDGLNFFLAEESIMEAGRGDWHDDEVRAPTVVEDGGHLKMWFAGQQKQPVFGAGIGYALQ